MSKVQAWKCPHTGKLFDIDARKEYDAHLRILSNVRKVQRRHDKATAEWDDFFAKAKKTLSTPTEIIDWVVANQKIIIARHNVNQHPSSYKTYKIERLQIDAQYKSSCSNSHAAPRSGVQNWASKKDKPNGYPGYYGRIVGDSSGVTARSSYFDTDMLRLVNVHTGSGGGGGPFQYTVTIFEADWPKMLENRFEAKIRGEK